MNTPDREQRRIDLALYTLAAGLAAVVVIGVIITAHAPAATLPTGQALLLLSAILPGMIAVLLTVLQARRGQRTRRAELNRLLGL